MKALFTGEYCPNECDLPPEKRTVKPAAAAKKPSTKDNVDAILNQLYKQVYKMPAVGGWTIPAGSFVPAGGFVPPTAPAMPSNAGYKPAHDQCPQPYCRAKGQATHTSHAGGIDFVHYECTICKEKWANVLSISKPVNGTFTVH